MNDPNPSRQAEELADCLHFCAADDSADLQELQKWMQQQPENSRTVERLRTLDRAIGRAFGVFDVPAELAARLRKIITESEGEPVSPASPRADAPSARQHTRPTFDHPIGRIRRWAVAGLATAVIALVALGIWRWNAQPGGTLTPDEVCRLALDWIELAESGDWQDDVSSALGRWPVHPELRRNPVQWSRIRTALDSDAVVYRMSEPGAPVVYLFVLSSPRGARLPGRFSADPAYPTGEYSIGACEAQGQLYVLVVHGQQDAYRRELRQPIRA